MKQLKKRFRDETMVEMLTFVRYILILLPCFLLILFGIYLYFDLGSEFLSRGLHILTILFSYLIITFISALVLKKGSKSISKLSNKYLILVPVINIIINMIYITNQYFDFFTELDAVGNYFSLIKLDNNNTFVSHYIFGYLMFESFMISIYVMFVINIEDEKILKFICSDKSNKLDKKCISEIIQDIFTYTMFIKFIVCVIFMIVMQYIKTKQAGDNVGDNATNVASNADVINVASNSDVNADVNADADTNTVPVNPTGNMDGIKDVLFENMPKFKKGLKKFNPTGNKTKRKLNRLGSQYLKPSITKKRNKRN